MLETSKLINDSFKFKFFKEFSTNTAFLLFPFISEVVLDWFIKVVSPIHFLLISLLILQTYLLVKIKKLDTYKVFLLNLLAPWVYLLLEFIELGWDFFNETLYVLYSLYILFNSLLRSSIFYIEKEWKNNINAILSMIDIFTKLSILPIFYFLLNIEAWSNLDFIEFYFWTNNHLNTFLFFIFIYLAIIFWTSVYLEEKRKYVFNNLLWILHKYSSWIVDSKDIMASLEQWTVDMSCKKMYKAVIFMDIRWFTNWSENNPPEDVTLMLNWFYREAEELIVNYETWAINKYVADEIVFIFDDLDDAIDFSIELKEIEIKYLNKFDLKIGFWINAWVLIYGWIGWEFKKEQTVIWDVVNVAARLEWWINMIKIPKHIVPNRYVTKDLWNLALKWKSEEMQIVEIISKK